MDNDTAPHTGDEIILAPNGRPFPTAKDADRALKASNRDPDKFGTLSYEGGYAIATLRKILEIREKQMSDKDRAQEAQRAPAPMRFWKVRIQPSSGDNDSPTVLLSVNNNAIVLNRGEEAIISEPHMVALHNASSEDIQPVDRITQARNPERALKVGRSLVYRFPYSVLGEATQDEFAAFMAKMNKATEQAQEADQLKAVGGTA